MRLQLEVYFNTVFQEITGKTPRQYRKDAKTA
jgi:YesN/AraC family two-component response regulator